MKKAAEEMIHDFFSDEVEDIEVPPFPEFLRGTRRGRFPAAEVIFAAAACLFILFSRGVQWPVSPLAVKAASFAQTRDVGSTILQGLENVREVIYPVLTEGGMK